MVLVLVTVIFIYGYLKNSNMTEAIKGAIVGGSFAILGSIVTLLGDSITTWNQKRKLIANTQTSFINILETIYLDGVNKMIEDCDKLNLLIKTDTYNSYSPINSTFLESDIFEVLDINILTKVFSRNNLQFNQLITLIIYMKVCNSNTPEMVTNQYIELYQKQIKQKQSDLDFIFRHENMYHVSDEVSKIERIESDYREGLRNSTLGKYDNCKKNLVTLKEQIEKLIMQLK